MNRRQFAICSNPDCKFSIAYKSGDMYRSAFCHLCGAELLFVCPHCKDYNFETKNQIHCGRCGKRIKPAPSKKPKTKQPGEK